MQACSRVVPPPAASRSVSPPLFLKRTASSRRCQNGRTGNAHRERKSGREDREAVGIRGRARRRRRRKKVSFFTVGAQKSILNSKVYQSELSLEFTASLIFSHQKPFPPPSTPPASTFPPVKTVKWNPAHAVDSPRVENTETHHKKLITPPAPSLFLISIRFL